MFSLTNSTGNMRDPLRKANSAWLATLAILFLITSVACSLGQTLVGEPTPTPTQNPPTPMPTWTPSPVGELSPAQMATLTVQAGLAWPTLTPTDTPIFTPTPTVTPTPFLTPTPIAPLPTPTQAPYLIVDAPVVNVREGPSVAYPTVGQVAQNQQYDIVGRNDTSTWWKICCVNGREVWITAQLTTPGGSVGNVPVAAAPPPPPPPQPTATSPPPATPQPYRPFSIGDGPQFFDSTNSWLTVWVKAFTGRPPIFLPVEGFRLKVLRNGVDVSKPDLTQGAFELSAPYLEDDPDAFGNRREYNLKYEYLPEAGDAEWTIYLADRGGMQVSPEVTFETRSQGGLREVYVGFYDLR